MELASGSLANLTLSNSQKVSEAQGMVLRPAPGKVFPQWWGGRKKGKKKRGRLIYTWRL